jgi:FkbM family methyltransferase
MAEKWSTRLFGREARYLTKALLEPRHYQAMFRIGTSFERPAQTWWNYITRSGSFPDDYRIRTPIGPIKLRLYSIEDLMTLNEVFARNDYEADARDQIVLDAGSNIGISAAYFLSRSPTSLVYAYEPVPENASRLIDNLSTFTGRCILRESAIGTESGRVSFGVESSGRYGGVGLPTGKSIEVDCAGCNEVLEELLKRHGRIDIFKADIEGYEERVLRAIDLSLRSRIRKIYVEWTFSENPIPDSHSFKQFGNIAQFRLRSGGGKPRGVG